MDAGAGERAAGDGGGLVGEDGGGDLDRAGVEERAGGGGGADDAEAPPAAVEVTPPWPRLLSAEICRTPALTLVPPP